MSKELKQPRSCKLGMKWRSNAVKAEWQWLTCPRHLKFQGPEFKNGYGMKMLPRLKAFSKFRFGVDGVMSGTGQFVPMCWDTAAAKSSCSGSGLLFIWEFGFVLYSGWTKIGREQVQMKLCGF